jgi:stearoyl-CoA desaturase (delta-9 desaturase)
VKWWEVDIGWLVIRLLQCLGLAKPKRIPPKVQLAHDKASIDIETVKAILTNRFQVLARYSRDVIFPVFREERRRAGDAGRSLSQRIRTLLVREPSLVSPAGQQQLAHVLAQSNLLSVVYQFRVKLQNLWVKSTASQAELLDALQEWCKQAEETGIKALREFVQHLKAHVPQKA